MATSELLTGEYCKWCGRHLRDSFLAEVAGGIEKDGAPLFPVLCLCGGITVIGAGTFVSYFDRQHSRSGKQEPAKAKSPRANRKRKR